MDYRHPSIKPDEFCTTSPLSELPIDTLPLKNAPYMPLIRYILSKEAMGIIKNTSMHVIGAQDIHTVYGFTLFGVSISMWKKVLAPEIRRLYSNLECDCLESNNGQYQTVYVRFGKDKSKVTRIR